MELSFWIEDDLTRRAYLEWIRNTVHSRIISKSRARALLTAVKLLVAEANADCVAMTAMLQIFQLEL